MRQPKIRDRAGRWHAQPYTLPARPDLMQHQIDGAAWMTARPAVLLASEPGTGKTAQIVEVINGLPLSARVLILCPSGLRANWLAELALWLTTPRLCMIAGRYIPAQASVVILQYDALAKFENQLRQFTWDLIAMDEAHALKNADSIKCAQILGDCQTEKLAARRAIVATATPILNRPAELWPLLAILGVDISREDFYARFCSHTRINECRNPEGLRDLLAPILLRQTKAECLKLPPKVRRIVAIEPTGELAAGAIAEETWKEEYEKAGRFKGGVAASKLAALRIRNALAKLELPAVAARLRAAVMQDGKLVIMCHHEEVVAAVAELFPVGAFVTYTGRNSAKQRNEAVQRFQQDPACCVFIGTIGAAGVGVTLTAARRMIFLEFAWNEALMEQASDRIHRIGQRRPVLIEYLVIAGSVDARSIALQVEKQDTIDAVFGRAA